MAGHGYDPRTIRCRLNDDEIRAIIDTDTEDSPPLAQDSTRSDSDSEEDETRNGNLDDLSQQPKNKASKMTSEPSQDKDVQKASLVPVTEPKSALITEGQPETRSFKNLWLPPACTVSKRARPCSASASHSDFSADQLIGLSARESPGTFGLGGKALPSQTKPRAPKKSYEFGGNAVHTVNYNQKSDAEQLIYVAPVGYLPASKITPKPNSAPRSSSRGRGSATTSARTRTHTVKKKTEVGTQTDKTPIVEATTCADGSFKWTLLSKPTEITQTKETITYKFS